MVLLYHRQFRVLRQRHINTQTEKSHSRALARIGKLSRVRADMASPLSGAFAVSGYADQCSASRASWPSDPASCTKCRPKGSANGHLEAVGQDDDLFLPVSYDFLARCLCNPPRSMHALPQALQLARGILHAAQNQLDPFTSVDLEIVVLHLQAQKLSLKRVGQPRCKP